MNKEEILKKAQSENKDEGEEFVKYKSSYWGNSGIFIVTVILLVFNLVHGQDLFNDAILSTVFAFVSFEALGKFVTVKDKASLVTAVLTLILCVIKLVKYMNGIMG